MPNYNDLIFTGADWKLFLGINGSKSYPLLVTDSIAFNVTVEDELIHVVGEIEAVGNKKNARKRTGKLNIEAGEILSICALEGLLDATYIDNATLSAVALQGGIHITWKNVNLNSQDLDIKGKEKRTLVAINFSALQAV